MTNELAAAVPSRGEPVPDDSSLAAVERAQRLRWNEVARAMPDLYPAVSTLYYRDCEIALLQREIGPLRGKRILKLDLWNEAVNTRILNWMCEQGGTCFGLDVSSDVVRRGALLTVS